MSVFLIFKMIVSSPPTVIKAEDLLEAQGINALLGRVPVPGDAQWDKSVAALDLTCVSPNQLCSTEWALLLGFVTSKSLDLCEPSYK